MHYTQNDKIRQATEGKIVVGVDIGSEKNYARAFKGNGIEITRKAFYFPNTLEGFKSFEEMVTKLTVPLAEKKIVVGVEPTGHYWFNFADYCQEKQMTVVTVAPQHVKHSKEMDDNTQRKDDRKDPRVIAKLVIEGRYCIPYRPKGVYAELRVAYNRRCEIVEAETRAKNRIRRWFDLYFPEYRTVYGSVAAITGMIILKQAPLPQDIVSLGVDGILQIWRANKLRAAGLKRAKTLFEAAQRSICPPLAQMAALSLPEDVGEDGVRVILLGGSRALVENMLGVADIGRDCIRLATRAGILSFKGKELALTDVREGALAVSGQIEAVLLPGAAEQNIIAADKEKYIRLASMLDAMSPLKVLGRGYAIARKEDGAVVSSQQDVRSGDRLTLRLKTDEIKCVVE